MVPTWVTECEYQPSLGPLLLAPVRPHGVDELIGGSGGGGRGGAVMSAVLEGLFEGGRVDVGWSRTWGEE